MTKAGMPLAQFAFPYAASPNTVILGSLQVPYPSGDASLQQSIHEADVGGCAQGRSKHPADFFQIASNRLSASAGGTIEMPWYCVRSSSGLRYIARRYSKDVERFCLTDLASQGQ